MEAAPGGLGRCSCAFWLAVVFDVLGLIILLLGVFGNLFFYDFLIYAGAIIIFLSLIWWVFWYTGNIEVAPEELEDDVGLLKKGRGLAGVVRRFSSRLSNGIRNSLRRNGVTRGQGAAPGQAKPRREGGRQVPVVLAMTSHDNVTSVSATVSGETLRAESQAI
ncbi:transmembrane protein 238-like [Triplophysa rosa]|uniref:Transmembrane protein 238-like n=1 Tax=Triplophysa rosa TaxID=992332 RepID=A0A9W7TV59_TRIRA|nr:transmembrane protein 238-like [Triplophysa rosa]KAI7803123.1 putative transmembrane protein 238-like [Triplophysa rosa]